MHGRLERSVSKGTGIRISSTICNKSRGCFGQPERHRTILRRHDRSICLPLMDLASQNWIYGKRRWTWQGLNMTGNENRSQDEAGQVTRSPKCSHGPRTVHPSMVPCGEDIAEIYSGQSNSAVIASAILLTTSVTLLSVSDNCQIGSEQT